MSQRVAIGSLLLALAAAASVQAQTQRSGGGEAQKLMQQYQQLAAEKTALQTQLAQSKKDLDGARAELAGVKKERDALKARSAGSAAAAARLTQMNASKDSAEKSLVQYKQRTTELVDRFKETLATLKGVETDRAELRKDNDALGVAYDKCAENNLHLYEISSAVLDRYDQVGFFTKVGAAEPFTKLTRTRIENLVDEYRERAQGLRVKKH